MQDSKNNVIEIRGFLHLDKLFRERGWSIPLMLEIKEPLSGIELARQLEIPLKEIEVIFVNGLVQSVKYMINPGDRVAFLPPGCPGPYRVALGFYSKHLEE